MAKHINTKNTHSNPPRIVEVARTSLQKGWEVKISKKRWNMEEEEEDIKCLPSWGGGLKPAEESLIWAKTEAKAN